MYAIYLLNHYAQQFLNITILCDDHFLFIPLSFSDNFIGVGLSKRLGLELVIFTHKMIYLYVCFTLSLFLLQRWVRDYHM